MKARIADRIAAVRAKVEARQAHDIPPACGAEPHYTPEDVAKLWKLSPNTVRSMFEDRPGVLKIGKAGGSKPRKYTKLRIPQSVLDKAHTEMAR